jgi:hypothetical protein
LSGGKTHHDARRPNKRSEPGRLSPDVSDADQQRSTEDGSVDLSSGADIAVIVTAVIALGALAAALVQLQRRGREIPRLSTDPPTIEYGRVRGYRLRVTNVAREPVNDLVAHLVGERDEECGDPESGHYIGVLDAGAASEFVLFPQARSAGQKLRVKYTFRDTAAKECEQVSRAKLPTLR